MSTTSASHRFRWQTCLAVLALGLAASCASKPPPVEAPPVGWTLDFEHPVRFQQLVDERLMVVGTTRDLYGIEPRTGQTLWRSRNISARSGDVLAIPDAPYVLVMDAAGGRFADLDTHVLAIARNDGTVFWESRLIRGRVLQAVVDPDAERLYVVAVRTAHGDDSGVLSDLLPGKGLMFGLEREPSLVALDLVTGRVLWEKPFGEEVSLRPAGEIVLDDKGDWTEQRVFDLGRYHAPFIADDKVCLTYHGVRCFAAVSGERVWSNTFQVNDGDLALTYTEPTVIGGTIFASGESRLRAIDVRTGGTRWESRRSDIFAEAQHAPDVVYAQLGGRFFDIESETWDWHGDFGVMAVDRASGKTLWTFDDADGAVTNVMVFGERVWLADEDDLIVLRQRDGKVLERIAHDFEEPPVYAALNDLGQIVLVNESEAAVIDMITLKPRWHVRHPPPGPGAWARLSAGLLQFSGNVLRLSSTIIAYTSGLVPALPALPLPGSAVSVKLISSKKIVGGMSGRTGRRMSYQAEAMTATRGAARLSGEYQYFVTTVEDVEKPALAVVELNTGRTARLLALPYKSPNLLIDDSTDSVYQVSGRHLTALRLR